MRSEQKGDIELLDDFLVYTYKDNLKQKTRIRQCFVISMALCLASIFAAYLLMGVSNDYDVEDPYFIDEDGVSHRYHPLRKQLPSLKYITEYGVSHSEELLSLDFSKIDEQVLNRYSYFIEGQWEEYAASIFGDYNIYSYINSLDGSYADQVISNSFIVTTFRRKPAKIVQGPYMFEGRHHFVVQSSLWQTTEGLNNYFNTRELTVFITLEVTPRNESTDGLKIRKIEVLKI